MTKQCLRLFLLVLLGVWGIHQPAFAEKVPPTSASQIQLSYAPVVKKVAPAVVNIYTRKIIEQRLRSPLLEDPFFRHFFGGPLSNGAPPNGLTRQRMESALGSGVLVSPSGLVVTSQHVIDGADEITVVLQDRREFEATLVSQDKKSDLAILKIAGKGENFPALTLQDSDLLEVGDLVLAIGNPFGVGQSVTSGIISALARTTTDINDLNYFIQTDAAINPGNSGGALVTMDGKLAGINAAIFSRDGGNLGIGFAVPSNMVRALVAAVETGHKTIERPWTGLRLQDVTPAIAESLKLPRPSGALVKALHPQSPADQAGIRVGDVITAIQGRPVDDLAAFHYRIATLSIGQSIDVTLYRKGEQITRSMTLGKPPQVPRDEILLHGETPLSGARIANLSPALIQELGLHEGSDGALPDTGVIIMTVVPNSPAAQLGLQPGDILLEINGKKVTTTRAASDLLAKGQRRTTLSFSRNGQIATLRVMM